MTLLALNAQSGQKLIQAELIQANHLAMTLGLKTVVASAKKIQKSQKIEKIKNYADKEYCFGLAAKTFSLVLAD